MKKITVLTNLILFTLVSAQALAQSAKVIGGLNSAKQTVSDAAMIIGPIAFLVTGIMFYVNKQQGQERLSATVIGTFIVAAASSIFALIASWVS